MKDAAVTIGTVREWHDDDGWGIINSQETPGGCWTHFSHLEMEGFAKLQAGSEVEFTWEKLVGFNQDGYSFRAVHVIPLPLHDQ